MNPSLSFKIPVVSEWDVHTLNPVVPALLQHAVVGVDTRESELIQMLENLGISVTQPADNRANLVIASGNTWKVVDEPGYKAVLEQSHGREVPVVMLDIGPRFLGENYPAAVQFVLNMMGTVMDKTP